ncbi:hypothetical protein HMPREF0083_05340 [Aneurinibacillus aneurinilyticus ATCC 12856]|uniref:Uncharacterized protein n=1 Tax=Aneurinibacillus aneurinilyticus ATCC 12856 TaxID=649747 RepID=U1Y2M4_ANEAE|nr:hypothetical protein HMPREF0083_05340 [Aneurinibacillus aneurinilyticus ATCC 12856]
MNSIKKGEVVAFLCRNRRKWNCFWCIGAVMMGMIDIYAQLEEIKKRLHAGGV